MMTFFDIAITSLEYRRATVLFLFFRTVGTGYKSEM